MATSVQFQHLKHPSIFIFVRAQTLNPSWPHPPALLVPTEHNLPIHSFPVILIFSPVIGLEGLQPWIGMDGGTVRISSISKFTQSFHSIGFVDIMSFNSATWGVFASLTYVRLVAAYLLSARVDVTWLYYFLWDYIDPYRIAISFGTVAALLVSKM